MAYEVERLTGFAVAAVEVVIQRVQGGAHEERGVTGAASTARARRDRGAARRRIDDLNVYPVPDGDTGTNLTLTVRAVAEALDGDGADDRAGARARGRRAPR